MKAKSREVGREDLIRSVLLHMHEAEWKRTQLLQSGTLDTCPDLSLDLLPASISGLRFVNLKYLKVPRSSEKSINQNTSKYIHRSTSKYLRVQVSTSKYLRVSRITLKYIEDIEVPRFT